MTPSDTEGCSPGHPRSSNTAAVLHGSRLIPHPAGPCHEPLHRGELVRLGGGALLTGAAPNLGSIRVPGPGALGPSEKPGTGRA